MSYEKDFDDLWSTIQALKEAIDFAVSNLEDAGVKFENIKNIRFFLNTATKEIDQRL